MPALPNSESTFHSASKCGSRERNGAATTLPVIGTAHAACASGERRVSPTCRATRSQRGPRGAGSESKNAISRSNGFLDLALSSPYNTSTR